MVQRQRYNKMTSEQPLKKKLRREDETDNPDETDFIHNLAENSVPTDLQALHLALPNINENDITKNAVNLQLHGGRAVFRTSESNKCEESVLGSNREYEKSNTCSALSTPNDSVCENISMEPAPSIVTPVSTKKLISPTVNSNNSVSNLNLSSSDAIGRTGSSSTRPTNHERYISSPHVPIDGEDVFGLDDFQNQLIKQCLCDTSEAILRKPFEGQQINGITTMSSSMLSEWSSKKVLQFLSNLQLLFDVYLKQNNKGFICSRIVTICGSIMNNEYNLIEQIISLCETRNNYINYLAARVFSSFLIIAKTNVNNEWLEAIVNIFTTENIDFVKMQFSLEVIKRVVEWKDMELHVLEDSESQNLAGTSSQEVNSNCSTIPFSDPESYDTSAIKGLIIKSLESKWPELIYKIQNLIPHNTSVQSQTCILTFLALWESIISVKANLSVIDTKPFHAHLEKFVGMLNNQLPPIIWKQLLSLFNEVLCYGSTLALQDMLPDDTCQLAHLIVRYVKDYRLLDSLPFKRNEGLTVNSFVGTISSSQPTQTNIDKTLLQKMVLLVLKSVAITIKETRSDSSDSSVGSDDSDFNQDMQVIERSIRDVVKKLDIFVKNSLDFHPETPFSKILIHLFSDQDDYMIEAMVCTLDITIGISYRNAVFPDLITMLNPIHSFIEFLSIVSHDSDVLLDYLVSNETCFLLYLLRFLKYTKRNWSKFISTCSEGSAPRGNELDDTMSVLIRLKMQISRLVSKDLFPYNITPILRLLETCENLYEGNEFS